MTATYNRRPYPDTYSKGFMDQEAANVQLAINAPATTVTRVTLASNVTNSTSSNQASGLKATVVSGTLYTFRWVVWITSTDAGGCTLVLTHPTFASTVPMHVRFSDTAAATFTDVVQTTLTVSPSSVRTVCAFVGTGVAYLDITCAPSASGTVELCFKPSVTGHTMTVLAGSCLDVFASP